MKDLAEAQQLQSRKTDGEKAKKANEEAAEQAAKDATAAFAADLKAHGPRATIAGDKLSVTVYTASDDVCGFSLAVVPVATSTELLPEHADAPRGTDTPGLDKLGIPIQPEKAVAAEPKLHSPADPFGLTPASKAPAPIVPIVPAPPKPPVKPPDPIKPPDHGHPMDPNRPTGWYSGGK